MPSEFDYATDPKSYIGLLPAYSSEFASEILMRASSWSKNTISNGQNRQWFQNYRLYYNADPNVTGNFGQNSFSITSDNGDVVRANYNVFRSIITSILNMTVNQPPALDAKAANSEPDSLVASQLFKDVLDFYVQHWKQGRTKKQLKKAVEFSLIMSNGYILVEWDPAAGKPYVMDEKGKVVRDGDLYVKARSVWDVFFDVNCEDDDELEWVIIRDYINRFELAARYPDHKDEIMNLPRKTDMEVYRSWGWDDNTDLVAVYKFYHKSSSTLPNGRYALTVDNDIVLYDGGNPYVDEFNQSIIPLVTIRAADGVGTLYGYSPANDLAPIQSAFNSMWTAAMTNMTAFGIQNILVERGSDINTEQLQGALNIIETAPGKRAPEPLQLTSLPKEWGMIVKGLEKLMEDISGQNSVVRGDPESSLKAASGRALGLLQAMAVQFNSGLQDSYQQAMQDVGNLFLRILRQFAKTDRVTAIVGKDKVMRLSEWNGGTFKNVGTIVAESVNPISKTIAGARDEAEFLLQNHLISTPQEYMMVSQTGRLDPLIITDQVQLNLIQQENEQLLKGGTVQVLSGDKHAWHIAEHLGLLGSPDIRNSSGIVQGVLMHVQQHKDAQFREQQMAGQPPGPPGQAPGQPPMGPPPGSPQMVPPGVTAQGHLSNLPIPGQPPSAPNLPPMPKGGNPEIPHRQIMTAHRKPAPQSPTAPGPTGNPVPIPETAKLNTPLG